MPTTTKKICAAALLVLTGTSAFAQLIPPNISIGGTFYTETYTERDSNGDKFMEETAPMRGITASAKYDLSADSLISFSTEFAKGSTKYTGAYQGDPYGTLITNGHDRFMWQGGIGYLQRWSGLGGLKTGFVLNTRILTDRLDQSGDGGYKRVNTLTTFEVNFSKNFYIGTLTVSPELSLKTLLTGTQKSYMAFTLTNTQKHGLGVGVSTNIIVPMGQNSVSIVPFYRVMNVQKSKPVYVTDGIDVYEAFEPKNKTKEVGLSLVYNF